MIDNDSKFCPSCGAQLSGPAQPYQAQPYGYPNYDSGSVGWAVLGFLFPLVGFILWLAWTTVKPKSARMAGLGALWSIIFSLVLMIVIFVALLIASPSFTDLF